MDLTHFEDHFVDIGGQFLTSSFNIKSKLESIKAFVFDWDGVFNDGSKNGAISSHSDIDLNGLKLLTYAYYMHFGNHPELALITTNNSDMLGDFAKEENISLLNVDDESSKDQAFLNFCNEKGISPGQVAFVYDDVFDLSIANGAGLKFMVGRLANPLLINYVEHNHLADYISASQGNEHALREITELLSGLLADYSELLSNIVTRDKHYLEFISKT